MEVLSKPVTEPLLASNQQCCRKTTLLDGLDTMHDETTLIATIAVSLALAFLAGLIAVRLRLPPLVGYLLAGVLVGPFTPGFVADSGLANQVSDIRVILLMFGVGLHFSLSDLLSVRSVAIPGAVLQIALATALGVLLALGLGWSI